MEREREIWRKTGKKEQDTTTSTKGGQAQQSVANSQCDSPLLIDFLFPGGEKVSL